MKQFFKTVLAVVVGMLIMNLINGLFYLSFFLLMGLSSLGGSSTVDVKPGSVLMVDMSLISLSEQSVEEDPFASLYSETPVRTIGILDAVSALGKAAEDPAISYLYLKTDGTGGGIATLEEFRKAVCAFRESGKPVVAYMENPSSASYYLASAADKVFMTSSHGGMNSVVGIATQVVFLKDLLDKLGVNVQLIRHGKYKSAGEMYIRNDISAENRLQYECFINSLWGAWADEIAESRGITADRFNALIDNLELNSPEDFLEASLVDELLDLEGLRVRLADYAGKDDYRNLNSVDLGDYLDARAGSKSIFKDKIAVIYASGEIVDGNSTDQVAGDRFARIISDVRKDKSVKAVVLRVNSPGGSVIASEKIKNELDRLGDEKPLVASYGDYAASGGYWISNNCRRIFSDKGTLTGSIGVFSMIPDFSSTINDLAHVNIVSINSNRHSDMYSLSRALDAEETEYMQASVEDIYERFVNIVSEGRELRPEFVDSIAQGRVWAGSDALEIGLVDEIGSLQDALRYAALIADTETSSDLSNYEIVAYPKMLSPFEQLLKSLSGEEMVFAGTPFENIEAAYRDYEVQASGQVFARMPYEISVR